MYEYARWGDVPRDRDDTSGDLSRANHGGSNARDRERMDSRDVFSEDPLSVRGFDAASWSPSPLSGTASAPPPFRRTNGLPG